MDIFLVVRDNKEAMQVQSRSDTESDSSDSDDDSGESNDEEEIQVWLSASTIVNFVLNNNLTLLTKVQYVQEI